MKNISKISIRILSSLALLFFTIVSYGQTTYEVTYTGGSFNNENSWLLWDATAGSELLCDDATSVPGTYSVPVPSGNTVELYAWESFGDNWNGATLQLARGSVSPDPSCATGEILYGPNGNPGGADGNGSLFSCPGGSPTDGGGGALAFTFINACLDVAVPTLGQWGLIILFLSLGIFGLIAIKNKMFSHKSVKL